MPGYHWPSDAEVLGAVTRTQLYLSARKQVNFLLTMAERSIEPNEQVDTSALTVEHVMPQSVLTAPAWTDYLERSDVQIGEAVAVMHTLGNLTLVASAYNSEMSNRSFQAKKKDLSQSPLRINNAVSQADTWLPADIEARSTQLAEPVSQSVAGPHDRVTGYQPIGASSGAARQAGERVASPSRGCVDQRGGPTRIPWPPCRRGSRTSE